MAVQDGSLCFLFENKGLMYNGKGFEMLAALNQHCCPDLVANAFTTLLLIFNDSMGASEEIMVSTPGSMGWSMTWPIVKSIFLQYSL